jgi:sortase A
VTRVVRGLGWALISVGAVILLYLVYLLWFTGLTTDRAQQQLERQWSSDHATVDTVDPEDAVAGSDTPPADAVDLGEAYAAVWFEHGDTGERLLHDEPLFVVEGVTMNRLRRGPGHYPDTSAPGEAGNLAVAGHRTTYGAPFYHLEELRPGDEVHVADRDRREWVYEVVEQRVVAPDELWVIGPDPLGTGAPTLTLTTCHPRFSAAQRLVVFAELTTAATGDGVGT